MNPCTISDALAQVTENGIGLGSIFNKLKIDIDNYKDVIDGFTKLNLELPQFKLDDGKANWDAIAKAIEGCDETALSYFKTLDDGNGTINNQSASVEGLGTHLEATGQAFDFAAIKANLLNISLNAGIMMLASLAIQGVVKALDNYIHRVENARSRTDDLFNDFNQMNNTLEEHKKIVSELSGRYDELSKGVNRLNNENVSLSASEYEEFLNINEQLANSFPELTKGIDENGNSILTLGTKGITAKEQLEELLQTEEDLNNFKIAQGLEDAFKGVYTYIEEANEATEKLNGTISDSNEAFIKLQDVAENGIHLNNEDNQLIIASDTNNQAELEYMNALISSVNEFWKSLEPNRRVEIDPSALFVQNFDQNTGAFEIYANAYSLTDEEISSLESIIQDNTRDISGALLDSISSQSQDTQAKIKQGENYWIDFIPNLVSGMKSKQTFKNLDSDLQDIAVKIVEGLDYSFANAMSEYNPDPYAYIRDNLIVPMGELNDTDKNDLQSSFEELLKLDAENLSQNNQAEIEKYIDIISDILQKEPIEIRSILGFDVEESQKSYNNALNKAKEQLGNSSDVQDFWGQNVLTEEDVALWEKATEGITGYTEAIEAYTKAKQDANNVEDNNASFDISTYKDQIDDIQSAISTLRSALDSFNEGTLDEDTILDLIQQFPELIPYVDLAADGFGNLSEGLGRLIEQQPSSLISSLQSLKEYLNTDEERAQVDALINSLQDLSSYGDTGTEAYATSIGSTWNDTANVIETVTSQFENLAKVQEAVADGLTMSATAAAELAKMYPEILDHAQVTANGQITLNEEVVQSILNGDKSIVDAQIAKLEADKAELTAKKSYAEAQLNIIKQVAEGEGNITKEVAQYRLDIANELLHTLIEAGLEEDKAYAAVAANMAGNMNEYNRIVGEIAQDTSVNMDAAAVSMANSININSINAQKSFSNLQQKVWDLADSVKAAANGERAGGSGIYGGGGSTSSGGIKARNHSGNFNTAITNYTAKDFNLSDFQSQLEIDIKGYTDAISNIDSQIEILKNLQASFENNGGIGGHGYKDKIKQLEKEKDALNKATKDSTSSAKDEFDDTIDFFERRVKVLQDSFDNLEKGMSNVFGADAKNALVTAQIGIVDEQIDNYTDALAMYRQKANDALSGVDSDLRDKIVNGAVQITDFIGKGNEEVVEAMEAYKGWADKVAGCTQKLEELKTQIRQLELQKFNNIMEEFNNQFDLRDDSINLIKKQIGLLEEAGELIGESFYSKQIEQSQKQLNILETEKVRLVKQLEDALASGRVKCCPTPQ